MFQHTDEARVSRRPNLANCVGFLVSCGLAARAYFSARDTWVLLLPTIAHELMIALAFVTRSHARTAPPPLVQRAVAYGRSYGFLAAVAGVTAYEPEWLAAGTPPFAIWLIAMLVIISGAAIDLWALVHLRRSFSLEPHARELVTTGPYRYVRHPLYLSYSARYLAALFCAPSLVLAAIVAVWAVFAWFSIRFEERVLTRAHPEYRLYRASTGALLPKLSRSNVRYRPAAATT